MKNRPIPYRSGGFFGRIKIEQRVKYKYENIKSRIC